MPAATAERMVEQSGCVDSNDENYRSVYCTTRDKPRSTKRGMSEELCPAMLVVVLRFKP
jgi:hypothetical protein